MPLICTNSPTPPQIARLPLQSSGHQPAVHCEVVSSQLRVCTAMAAASGLASKLLRLQGSTTGLGVGFFSVATVASAASSDGGNNSACPAYPWPHDGARGGHKVFMQHDCAACHSMLPYAGLTAGARGGGEAEAKAAEIVVVHEAAQPELAPATTLHGPPDLSIITRTLEGLRHSNLYAADELKKRMALLPTPVWLHFLQPYMKNPQAA